MAAYTAVNLPIAPLHRAHEDTKLRTALNAARFTGSILSSLVGLLLGRPAWWATAPRLPAIGGGPPERSRWWALPLGLGPGPAGRGLPPAIGRPERSQPSWGASGANGRFCGGVGCICLLWDAWQLDAAVSLLYSLKVMPSCPSLGAPGC